MTTGPRSLNRHIHGHARDISEQAPQPCYESEVYDAIRWQAVEERIIPMVQKMGRWMPQHEREWTNAQAGDVVTLCHRFADERGYWLTEYSEDGNRVEKVWYGEARHA